MFLYKNKLQQGSFKEGIDKKNGDNAELNPIKSSMVNNEDDYNWDNETNNQDEQKEKKNCIMEWLCTEGGGDDYGTAR